MSQRLTVLVAALALAASPALAQTNTATTPNSGNPGNPSNSGMSSGPSTGQGMSGETDHSTMSHRSRMASKHMGVHRVTPSRGKSAPSAADHSADQLNAQVLSNMQGGSAGSMNNSGGTMGAPGSMGRSGDMGTMGAPGSMDRSGNMKQ